VCADIGSSSFPWRGGASIAKPRGGVKLGLARGHRAVYLRGMNMIDSSLAGRPVHPALWVAAGLMALPELVFWAQGAGFLGPEAGRYSLYTLFAWWDVAFEHARANGVLSLQLVWSLVTHAFMHGGLLHLLMNGAAFLGLGHAVTQLAGIRATAVIFAVTAAAGALTFSLITDHPGPLVGASGVVFGLIAVLTAWQERALRRHGQDRTAIWQRILGLVAINVVLDIGMGGMLAWEAHLGGFVAGWLMASVVRPRLRRRAW
jgi:membrane associated rhomboid family serine protease